MKVKSQAMQQFKTMTKPQPHHFKTVNSIWSAYNVIHHVTLKMVKMDNGQTLVMASWPGRFLIGFAVRSDWIWWGKKDSLGNLITINLIRCLGCVYAIWKLIFILHFPLSLSLFSSLAEIEAVEACKWLRAAGFPQYAQMYEGKCEPQPQTPPITDFRFALHWTKKR